MKDKIQIKDRILPFSTPFQGEWWICIAGSINLFANVLTICPA